MPPNLKGVVVLFVVGTIESGELLAPHIPIFELVSPNFVLVLSCTDKPKNDNACYQ